MCIVYLAVVWINIGPRVTSVSPLLKQVARALDIKVENDIEDQTDVKHGTVIRHADEVATLAIVTSNEENVNSKISLPTSKTSRFGRTSSTTLFSTEVPII